MRYDSGLLWVGSCALIHVETIGSARFGEANSGGALCVRCPLCGRYGKLLLLGLSAGLVAWLIDCVTP